MAKRILFVTCNRVKDYYGITSGLYNSAKFVVDFLKAHDWDAKLVSVVDSNAIDREVTQFDPEIVIIEALWVSPTKFKELLSIKRHKARRWIVRIHSKAPFLANEGLALRWITEYTKIDESRIEIAPNTKELCLQLSAAIPLGKIIYLPNVYQFEDFTPSNTLKDPEFVDIGCFGAVRPMKNTFQQALAAIEFAERNGKTLRFHINATRLEQTGENVLKNLRALFDNSYHQLVEHYWYKHREFLTVASQMDLGMQVSFSESFNIVTADFVAARTPIVVSDDIEWMPGYLKTTPTSHEKMVRKLNRAYGSKMLSRLLQTVALKWYNLRAKIAWLITI